MAGIAAGDEDRIYPGKLGKDAGPLLERELYLFRITVVLVERGVPDPDVLAVLVGEAGHLDHHVDLRQREMRAIRRIVRSWRDQLDGVRSEDREIPDVLFPHRHVPRVVGVRLRAVSQLVAAQCHLRRGDDREIRRHPQRPALHSQLAQQSADAEQHASGVRAQHKYPRRSAAPGSDGEPESFPTRSGGCPGIPERPGSPLRRGCERADGDDRYRFSRPGGGHRQPEIGTPGDLFDQDAYGGALLHVQVGRSDDRGALEIDQRRRIGLSLRWCLRLVCCRFWNPHPAHREDQQGAREGRGTRTEERTHR